MTNATMALTELVEKEADIDVLCQMVQFTTSAAWSLTSADLPSPPTTPPWRASTADYTMSA